MVRKTVDRIHTCWICGNDFTIKVRLSDKKIMTKCFHSRISKYFFLKWIYKLETKGNIMEKEVVFTSTFWKVVAFTKPQRWLVHGIWWLFRGWQKIDYWECSKKGCNKK